MKLKSALTTFALTSALFLGACGNGDGGTASQAAESTDPAKNPDETIEGSVGIDGSSTVFPIMEAVSEEYAVNHPNVKAPVGVSGTGGGFKRMIAGESDISNASRPIKEEEANALEENGIKYTEFEIAYDGLSVVVNKENDFVDQLSVDELKKMWLESEQVKTWADVRDGWPDKPITFYSPGTDSGTYDYWNEVILEEEQMRKDATLSEDDNVLVQGVMGDKGAIGFFGFSYYVENQDNLKIVPIVNSKGDAVTPNHDTIMNADYEPLSRPLYFYVRNDALTDKNQVYDYVKFALENAGSLAEEVGYISLQENEYTEALDKLATFAQ
jgi:phosphate transport system substrate-binding protein